MEPDIIQPSGQECECGCNHCDPIINPSCTKTWIQSVKRKLDELEEDRQKFNISSLLLPEVARVEIKNECFALREMVTNQQQSIRDLSVELEEERNASSSAANEAMSMILRLQREKAEIEMEARQFRRFSEQKTSHDQQEIAALEELLCKREQTIQSLTCEVEAYKYRMMSYGLSESEAEDEQSEKKSCTNSIITNSENKFGQFFDYPPLKCNTNELQSYPESETETIDIEKYTFTESPCTLKDIEQRINELENSPHQQPVLEKVIVGGYTPRKQKPVSQFSQQPVLEKVIVGYSPRKQKPASQFSQQPVLENYTPRKQKNASPFSQQPVLEKVIVGYTPRKQKPASHFSEQPVIENYTPRKQKPASQFSLQPVLEKVIVGYTPRKQKPASQFSLEDQDNLSFKVDTFSEFESETSNRIYTVDSIHYNTIVNKGPYDFITSTPKDSMCHSEIHSENHREIQDPEVMKLYARLHALEADRESMKQAITNMRTDKAQLVLLKNIAQNLCKEMAPQARRMPVKKYSVFGNFGHILASLILWRRKTSQSKYMFGMTASNPGLMVLFDKGYQMGQWRCVSRTQL